MVKKGEVSLSDPVEKLLPKDPDNPYADYSVQQMYDFLAGYALPRAVGSQYEYSNLAVGLLGLSKADISPPPIPSKDITRFAII